MSHHAYIDELQTACTMLIVKFQSDGDKRSKDEIALWFLQHLYDLPATKQEHRQLLERIIARVKIEGWRGHNYRYYAESFCQ